MRRRERDNEEYRLLRSEMKLEDDSGKLEYLNTTDSCVARLTVEEYVCWRPTGPDANDTYGRCSREPTLRYLALLPREERSSV